MGEIDDLAAVRDLILLSGTGTNGGAVININDAGNVNS